MASVSPPVFSSSHSPRRTQTRRNSLFPNPKLPTTHPLHKFPPLPLLPTFSNSHHRDRVSDSSLLCHSQTPSSSDSDSSPTDRGWDSRLRDAVTSVVKRIEDYLNSGENVEEEFENKSQEEDEEWDWERWNLHFREVDEQEKLISLLKSQIANAVYREEYEYASKLKVAVAAAATNDVVGRVVARFNRAVLEERYHDAAFFRDYAGMGLMGWWAGISEDLDDPYGRIIHIGVEHGRYVARSFSPRHLATAVPGVPLFEIFLTMSSKGEYKQKVVYLKRTGGKFDSTNSSKLLDPSSNISQLDKTTELEKEEKERSDTSGEDRVDDSDVAEELDGVENILRDMIPGDIRVVKVTAPDNVTKDFISNLIGQIVEEEEDEVEDESDDDDNDNDDDEDDNVQENDTEMEIVLETNDDDAKDENHDETGVDVLNGNSGKGEDRNEITVEVVIGGPLPKLSAKTNAKALLRVPAKLEKKDRLSFSLSIEEDEKQLEVVSKESGSEDKSADMQGQRSINNVMSDLAKFAMNREKIPKKVLKDVEELINLTLSKARRRQPLSGTTTFKRIEIPASSDILNGLYIGAHGFHTSEVIHLSRKFGQWNEDGVKQKSSSLEFYEYVEALKLTGDPRVPAGQVAFRAKVGKQYQLPHKGIIPEEFGVVARYKGQGRLAEPGFKNPRWVDGELVVLDGKYIKGGPVVGFVYWAPDYHFLVFFNRLRLPE